MTEASAALEGDADSAAHAAKPKAGKRKLILLALPVLLALVGAALWFFGPLSHLLGSDKKPAQQAATVAEPTYVEVPEIIANLNGNPRRQNYVKLKPRLELASAEDIPRIKAVMPRLLDLFQTYLREMRPEELHGSGGTYRLREELIARANIAAAPARVVDVLLTDMLVQ
jgi:flagellar protein FliL